jgi:hypothetical protein
VAGPRRGGEIELEPTNVQRGGEQVGLQQFRLKFRVVRTKRSEKRSNAENDLPPWSTRKCCFLSAAIGPNNDFFLHTIDNI